jgi:virginiamycin B lyase
MPSRLPSRFTLLRLMVLTLACASLAACTGLAERSPVGRGPVPPTTTTLPPGALAGGDTLLTALRSGGYVLVLRQALTGPDPAGDEDGRVDPADCSVQPVLSDAGRGQARAIGAAMRRVGAPFPTVLSSPGCAGRDTAFFAFGRAQAADELRDPVGAAERVRLGKRLRTMASAPPRAGTNTALVTGVANISAAFGVTPAEGETLVIAPRRGGSPRLVRRVRASGWAAMARLAGPAPGPLPRVNGFRLPGGSRPAGVVAAADGSVWWTAEGTGRLGRLDPATGRTRLVGLGAGSAPRGLTIGPDNGVWVADAGADAILRVDRRTLRVSALPLPNGRGRSDLQGVAFDGQGLLWFTGSAGVLGRLDPRSGRIEVFDAPGGPAGIAATAQGGVFYAPATAGNLAAVDMASGEATVVPSPGQAPGAGAVAADERGRVWVSEPGGRRLAVYDPASEGWREWPLPGGARARPGPVWVDADGLVWLGDAGARTLLRFDPVAERFASVALPAGVAGLRALGGREGEVWGAAAGADLLVAARA